MADFYLSILYQANGSGPLLTCGVFRDDAEAFGWMLSSPLKQASIFFRGFQEYEGVYASTDPSAPYTFHASGPMRGDRV
jgi:hypothetical protein